MDKHVNKILLEAVQMLCSARRILEPDDDVINDRIYRLAHKNHPVTIWCRKSRANFVWALDLGEELHNEWRFRYGHPKTIVGAAAMAHAKATTLILVTNTVAARQWRDELLRSSASSISYSGSLRAVLSRTKSSIWRLVKSAGTAVRVRRGRCATSAAGASHSWLTPTSAGPRPSAHTISVADGSREAIRMRLAAQRELRYVRQQPVQGFVGGVRVVSG